MELKYFIIGAIVAGLLIAFFRGVEIAFISSNRLSIELRKKQGSYAGKIWASFLGKPLVFISITLLVVQLFLVIFSILWSHSLQSVWVYWSITNVYIQLALTILLATLSILIVEGIFITLFHAKGNAILGSRLIAYIISLVHSLTAWLMRGMFRISEWILKYIFNVKLSRNTEVFSSTDLDQFIRQLDLDEERDKTDMNSEIFENVLHLSETKIRACLVPRKEIVAVERNMSMEQIKNVFIETKLSKLVVYDQSIDNIQGYIHQLDLFRHPQQIDAILLPIPVVPESMNASDLIKKFSKERKSIGWVIDEFGGTSGIVTMEDLLEEIFGDIYDEHDIQEELVDKQISENEFVLSGRLGLGFLHQKYNLQFDKDGEAETLSGYIINQHGAIPTQKVRLILGNYQLDIISVSDTRIEMVKLKILR